MYSNDFEAAFSEFLECREYDEAESSLFTVVRQAFIAGWLAAGGSRPCEERLFQTLDFSKKEK